MLPQQLAKGRAAARATYGELQLVLRPTAGSASPSLPSSSLSSATVVPNSSQLRYAPYVIPNAAAASSNNIAYLRLNSAASSPLRTLQLAAPQQILAANASLLAQAQQQQNLASQLAASNPFKRAGPPSAPSFPASANPTAGAGGLQLGYTLADLAQVQFPAFDAKLCSIPLGV